jgi:phage terminase large subunit
LVYMDYNPDRTFWVDTDIIPRADCGFLQLTFMDNEMLPEPERDEILSYRLLGYNSDGTIKNPYYANLWQVYGLGNIGSLQGVVFPTWDEVAEIPNGARLLYTGVDFGYSVSKFACLNIYQLDGVLILDELVYSNHLTNPEAAQAMNDAGYSYSTAYCDHAEPKSIEELRRAGIDAVPCDSKTDIKNYAIKKLNNAPFQVTSRSQNLMDELRVYVWDEKTNKPQKSNQDHLMDAMMYAIGSGDKYNGSYATY